MRLPLRSRIFLTLVPLLLLLVVLGVVGAVLLYELGGRIDAILRENYRSVRYMQHLNEALERIDSSFQFALAGHEELAHKQFRENWEKFRENLELEKENITLPGEEELALELSRLSNRYWEAGQAFHVRPTNQAYFSPEGLHQQFGRIKSVSGKILHINQENMEQASRDAREAAFRSLVSFAFGLMLATALALVLAWWAIHGILGPIRTVTQSALGISAGNLDQVIPVLTRDELGQLAEAFNVMARHLRGYRQSQLAQLLRAQRTSQATIDSFPDPILVIDGEGHVEMANPVAQRLLGVVPTKPGQPAPVWQPPEPLRQPLALALRGQQDYLPEGFDKVISLRSDGRELVVLPRILTIRDPFGHLLGAAVLLKDVTRFRLLDEMKSNLVATASHELKTPLTSIRLAVHLLLEEAAGPLMPKQVELLLDARDNCERLLAVVNNLLDLGRLEQGRRQLEVLPESPVVLVRSAVESVRARAEERGVALVVEVPENLPPVAVDAAQVGIALRNLLDNALTYTDAGGRVSLAACEGWGPKREASRVPSDLQAGADAVTFTVSDTGIGIPPDQLPHVFGKFFRVPGRSRGSGTGLGLAVVREIVTAHGGTITCTSQPGVGTSFRFTLPRADRGPASEGAAPAEEGSHGQR